MTDFERQKQTVSGHSVLMTSWFDEDRQTWHASAPAYSYINSLLSSTKENHNSRQAAVAHLSKLLTAYFERSHG